MPIKKKTIKVTRWRGNSVPKIKAVLLLLIATERHLNRKLWLLVHELRLIACHLAPSERSGKVDQGLLTFQKLSESTRVGSIYM